MATVPILGEATEDQLAAAVFENLHDLFRSMANLLNGEISESDKLARHVSFPTNPMFKGAWRTRLSETEADGAIKDTIEWFRERNAPYFFWWTGPDTRPQNLPDRLRAHGFIDMAEQQEKLARGIKQTQLGAPCMAAELSRLNEEALSQIPDDFIIREVGAESELNDFKRIFVETYEIPEWAGQAWVDATHRIGIGRTPWRLFVGYLKNEPVATNMLFNGGGVASVYAVATAPAARGKGIGGAITLKPLIEARDEAGYRYGVLFSTEMGVSVYERIGFRRTEARINRYLWRAA